MSAALCGRLKVCTLFSVNQVWKQLGRMTRGSTQSMRALAIAGS